MCLDFAKYGCQHSEDLGCDCSGCCNDDGSGFDPMVAVHNPTKQYTISTTNDIPVEEYSEVWVTGFFENSHEGDVEFQFSNAYIDSSSRLVLDGAFVCGTRLWTSEECFDFYNERIINERSINKPLITGQGCETEYTDTRNCATCKVTNLAAGRHHVRIDWHFTGVNNNNDIKMRVKRSGDADFRDFGPNSLNNN